MRGLAASRPAPARHQQVQLGAWPLSFQTTPKYEAFKTQIGRNIDRLVKFRGVTEITAAGDAAQMAAIGATVLETGFDVGINVGGKGNTGTLGNVATGVVDSYYIADAEAAAAYGGPIVARLCHEFNGSWEHWGYTDETPEQFVTGWKYVVDLFRVHGATNVKWCWNPNIWGHPGDLCVDPTEGWYPGADYVDVFGLDGYCTIASGHYKPIDLFMESYTALTELGSQPIIIPEFGVAEDPRWSKAQWFREFFAMVRDEMPRLESLSYWNVPILDGNNGDFSIDSTGTNPAALAAFKAGVNSLPLVA